MKYYEKTLYSVVDAASPAMPLCLGQRAHVECHFCHRTTVIPVPPTYVDWEKVAMDYKRYCENMTTRIMLIEQACDLRFGATPVRDYLANEFKMMRLELLKQMGQLPPGSSSNE